MKTLSKTILTILCIQLVLGNQPLARAQGGLIQAGVRSSTRNYTKVERTKDEQKIDTALEAEEYIRGTLAQNELFSNQCLNKDGEVDQDRAFVLSENIPYSDMQVKNCAQEMEKLYHMNKLADELVAEFNVDLENLNCSQCSVVQNESSKADLDIIPPGEACSLATQAKYKKEPCNTYCLFKPAMAAATMGMSALIGSAITGGNDGCPKENGIKQMGSCALNMMKGVVKGIWEAISGLSKLVWEGLKWCGKKIAQGAKWLFWDAWQKTEDQTSSSAHAVSQADKNEVESYEKDKGGWFKRKLDAVMDFIKELTYVGLFERESKCMDCSQKGQLMCEIGGRVASDVVGFTFTLGAGYGAIKTAVTKLGPKVADLVAKTATILPRMEAGSRMAKVGNAMSKVAKPIKWIGKTAVRVGKPISTAIAKKWKAFKLSKAYVAIMKPGYTKAVDGFKKFGNKAADGFKTVGNKAATSVPGKIVISAGRGAKKAFNGYMEFDSKIFARGAAGSAGLLGDAGIGMTKLQVARMYAELTKTAEASKAGVMIDTKGNRVMRVPTNSLSSEQLAQFNRAGVKLTEASSSGETIIRMDKKIFAELKDGKFVTRYSEELGVPISKDGTVVIKQGPNVAVKNVKDLSLDEVSKLRDEGAVFTTKEHPNAMLPHDPNNITAAGAKIGPEGEIVVKDLENGNILVLDASKVKPEEIKEWKKKGYPITNKADAEWNRPVSKLGEPEGDAINHTVSAQLHDMRANGKGEEASQIALNDVKQLNVMKESGDISDASLTAKKQLTSSNKVKSQHLEGIESSRSVETSFDHEKGIIRFDTPEGASREVSLKKGGNYTVETYQDGKMAVIKDVNTGKVELHDLTKTKSTRVATFSEKDAKVLDEAMAKTVNGKSADVAALDEVKLNLEMNKDQNHRIIEVNGERKIEIDAGADCKPNKINIGSDRAI